MNKQLAQGLCTSTLAITTAFAALVLSSPPALAQAPAALQARIQEIKIASAANKKALAHYNWQESQTISIKGEVKKQQPFLVSIGPDGQQQKTPINAQPDQTEWRPTEAPYRRQEKGRISRLRRPDRRPGKAIYPAGPQSTATGLRAGKYLHAVRRTRGHGHPYH